MNELERDLSLHLSPKNKSEELTHSVPFGAHSFIENQASDGIYISSRIHSDASFLPLLHRGQNGSAQTIKHFTYKQLIAEEDDTEAYASRVKQKKKHYKALRKGENRLNNTLESFRAAVVGYYESSPSLRSQRLVKAHAVSLGVASDLVKTTIRGVHRDTAFLEKRGNEFYKVTEAVASLYEDTKEVIDDIHEYVRENAVSTTSVAADDPRNDVEADDMKSRLTVWSSHLRPTTNRLLRRASERSKIVDDQKNYTK